MSTPVDAGALIAKWLLEDHNGNYWLDESQLMLASKIGALTISVI